MKIKNFELFFLYFLKRRRLSVSVCLYLFLSRLCLPSSLSGGRKGEDGRVILRRRSIRPSVYPFIGPSADPSIHRSIGHRWITERKVENENSIMAQASIILASSKLIKHRANCLTHSIIRRLGLGLRPGLLGQGRQGGDGQRPPSPRRG